MQSQERSGLRAKVHRQLFARDGRALSITNKFIVYLILLSVVVWAIGTEDTVYEDLRSLITGADIFFGCVFSIEYVARVWAAGEDPRYSGITGRLRYTVTIWAIVDLVAILPFMLSGTLGDSFLLRLVRIFRIISVAKAGRHSDALNEIVEAVIQRRYQLGMSFLLACSVLIFAATGMYVLEREIQPAVFGSVPRSLWWAITSLTPMAASGSPITIGARFFAAISAIAGIAMVAMPTAILASAFNEVFQKRHALKSKVVERDIRRANKRQRSTP